MSALFGVGFGYLVFLILFSVFAGSRIADVTNAWFLEILLLDHAWLMVLAFFFCKRYLSSLRDVVVAYVAAEVIVIALTATRVTAFNDFYWLGFPLVVVAYDLFLFLGLFVIFKGGSLNRPSQGST